MSQVKAVLLDIEGTVSSISFVKDVLVSTQPAEIRDTTIQLGFSISSARIAHVFSTAGFNSSYSRILLLILTVVPCAAPWPALQFPYTLTALPQVLSEKWDSDEFAPYRSEFPAEYRSDPADFLSHVRELTKNDVKIAYLKNLQGGGTLIDVSPALIDRHPADVLLDKRQLIRIGYPHRQTAYPRKVHGYLWLQAYRSGAIKAPVYPDVVTALQQWTSRGLKVYIYSSGSVLAQQLFFEHTDNAAQADLRPFLAGHFDTVNAGLKTRAESYEVIARETGWPVGDWVFLTDNVKEVEAATAAGMHARIVEREGNAPVSEEDVRRFGPVVTDFVRDEGLQRLLGSD
ncbi:hypothetical protein Dda_0138 [Drechslerella dactyloides]|uniref:Enolase-phosphatase E1 n=1 Tax=Drechslerella dactyloides TaxID=74499 RepID=A0AAD6J3T4_DREDA|nr:hypothetical protein Dda_0138 [Drechslerella dactyloides]